MNKEKRKQIFVHRKIRKSFLDNGEKINICKYCILDLLRRFKKNDTEAFEYKKKFISNWLGITASTLSEHLKYLEKETKLIEQTDFGIELTDKFPIDLYLDSKNTKPLFVIIDVDIKTELCKEFGLITFEQFAILTTIFTLQLKRDRKITKSYLANTLLLDRETVKNAFEKLQKLELLQHTHNPIKLTDDANLFFEPLKSSIWNNRNKFGY